MVKTATSLVKRTPSAIALPWQCEKTTLTETPRSTDAELISSILDVPEAIIQAQEKDMHTQLCILRKIVDEVNALQPTPGSASNISRQETELKLQVAKKIRTFFYLTNLEIALISNANKIATFPPKYVPARLLLDRRHWLRQRAYFKQELEAPCRDISEKKANLCESEVLGPFVGKHEDVVFGEWPLVLPEVEWNFVVYP
jgi:hypothetical protein